jgi:hypothetical protein
MSIQRRVDVGVEPWLKARGALANEKLATTPKGPKKI